MKAHIVKLIWFFGGIAASGLLAVLIFLLIQSSHGERGSGRRETTVFMAEAQGEQAPDREPERSGSGRKDSQQD